MRSGFTTGSCAAAAAKAAAYMLLTGREKETISILTPKGVVFHAAVATLRREADSVCCGVRKDGGDDPDVTTGALICAEVSGAPASVPEESEDGACVGPRIVIDGGAGVGRVTLPGLDQPVGHAAINRVPRAMIEREVRSVCALCDYRGVLSVVISVPEGEALAEQTFNPRLGIVGGISILGTSGVVEPMSEQALLAVIRTELNQKRALGFDAVVISPGNYGLDFMRNTFGYDLDKSVKCSNFIGAAIDMAKQAGFRGLLLVGHIGKLVKVSGGIFNTHSKEGDCRMELLAAAGLRAGCGADTALALLGAPTTEEGVHLLKEAGCLKEAMEYLLERILFYLNRRAAGGLQAECILYANSCGLLAQSAGAAEMLEIKSFRDRKEG